MDCGVCSSKTDLAPCDIAVVFRTSDSSHSMCATARSRRPLQPFWEVEEQMLWVA